jgi:hypothetical protein
MRNNTERSRACIAVKEWANNRRVNRGREKKRGERSSEGKREILQSVQYSGCHKNHCYTPPCEERYHGWMSEAHTMSSIKRVTKYYMKY